MFFFFCMESYFSHFKKNSPQIRITNQFGEVLHGSNAGKYTFFQNLQPSKISILHLRVNSNLKNNFHTTATTRTKKQGSSRHLPAQSINSYTRVRCEIFSTPSMLVIMTSVRHYWYFLLGVFNVNFGDISHIVLMFKTCNNCGLGLD